MDPFQGLELLLLSLLFSLSLSLFLFLFFSPPQLSFLTSFFFLRGIARIVAPTGHLYTFEFHKGRAEGVRADLEKEVHTAFFLSLSLFLSFFLSFSSSFPVGSFLFLLFVGCPDG